MYSRDTPQMCERHLDYQNLFPGGKHTRTIAIDLVHGTDEEFEGLFTGRYNRTSAVPRKRKRLHGHLRGRAELATRLFDRGYQSPRRRSVSPEDQCVPRLRPHRLSTDVSRRQRRSKNNHDETHQRAATFSSTICPDDLCSKKIVVKDDYEHQLRPLSQIAHNI